MLKFYRKTIQSPRGRPREWLLQRLVRILKCCFWSSLFEVSNDWRLKGIVSSLLSSDVPTSVQAKSGCNLRTYIAANFWRVCLFLSSHNMKKCLLLRKTTVQLLLPDELSPSHPYINSSPFPKFAYRFVCLWGTQADRRIWILAEATLSKLGFCHVPYEG
jgi:hypothetical protein